MHLKDGRYQRIACEMDKIHHQTPKSNKHGRELKNEKGSTGVM